MAVHPLFGQRLAVVFAKRTRTGRYLVVVEDPNGHRLELPAQWTDLVPTLPLATVRGNAAKVDAENLKAMRDFLDAKRTVDNKFAPDVDRAMLTVGSAENGHGAAGLSRQLDAVAGAGAAQSGRRLGAAAASAFAAAGRPSDAGSAGGNR